MRKISLKSMMEILLRRIDNVPLFVYIEYILI